MARAPQAESADLVLPELETDVQERLDKSSRNRRYIAGGIGVLIAGASFAMANKRMATNRAIIVGAVLGVVSYALADLQLLPKATSDNYQF